MAEAVRDVMTAVGSMGAEPVLRAVEVFSSLLSWTVLSAAHRSGSGGRYEYDSYTPLSFMLAATILHWLFAMGIPLLKRSTVVDAEAFEKIELFGSALALLFIYTAAVAGASTSTVLHDEFSDSSVCSPRHASDSQKSKAAFFCSHVSAAVTFAFFSCIAATGSMALVLVASQRNWAAAGLGGLVSSGGDRSDAYNPIDHPAPEAGEKYAQFHTAGIPMEAISHQTIQPPKNAAMDL